MSEVAMDSIAYLIEVNGDAFTAVTALFVALLVVVSFFTFAMKGLK